MLGPKTEVTKQPQTKSSQSYFDKPEAGHVLSYSQLKDILHTTSLHQWSVYFCL